MRERDRKKKRQKKKDRVTDRNDTQRYQQLNKKRKKEVKKNTLLFYKALQRDTESVWDRKDREKRKKEGQKHRQKYERQSYKWTKRKQSKQKQTNGEKSWSSAVFFNLGSAEPTGSAKVILGSAKYEHFYVWYWLQAFWVLPKSLIYLLDILKIEQIK